MVQLETSTYATYLRDRFNRESEGPLTDFMTRRDGRLMLGDAIDLNALAARYGAPLEVVYLPQITNQVHRMQAWAESARRHAAYSGEFLYAYATKANFSSDVVMTALEAGAHYETSAAPDVEIALMLFRQGKLPAGRMLFCNGSKEPNYISAIRRLRLAGCADVVAVLDDTDELDDLIGCPAPLKFGVRERAAGNRDGTHPGNDRFGLTAQEIEQVGRRLEGSRHELAVYHAMIGSQVENREHFLETLRASVENFCALRQQFPTLRYFNFGGGVPTSGYRLDFEFDYETFLTDLMDTIRQTCKAYGVPMPDLIGEFGRYTVANHSVYLMEVGKVKRGAEGQADWFLMNGSMMVTIPDSVLVDGQEFVILPLDGWDAPVREVRMAGRRTCDSDDVYPRPHQPALTLPDMGAGAVVAICGIGAYQQMISGRGGAHHCLSPEARRITISLEGGRLVMREQGQQTQTEIMRLLGYQPQPEALPLPVRRAPALEIVPAPRTRTQAPRRRVVARARVVRPGDMLTQEAV